MSRARAAGPEIGFAGVRAPYPSLVEAVEAVLVDAGGVLMLPDRAVVSAALGPGPWGEAPEALDRAHYRAIAAVDEARPASDRAIFPIYVAAYLEALGVSPNPRVVERLSSIFNAGVPSWTAVIPESAAALRTIAEEHRVAIVSNSQGWMERHLRERAGGYPPGARRNRAAKRGLGEAAPPLSVRSRSAFHRAGSQVRPLLGRRLVRARARMTR